MAHPYNDTMAHPVLGHGALPRPRSGSDGGGNMDRQRERQLVGSLTNSYKFKGNGLVKKVRHSHLLALTCRPCQSQSMGLPNT